MINLLFSGRIAKVATQPADCTGLAAHLVSCAVRRHICSPHIGKGVVCVAADARRRGQANVERITDTCTKEKWKRVLTCAPVMRQQCDLMHWKRRRRADARPMASSVTS